MRVAALIVGIFGAIAAFIGAMFVIFVSGVAGTLGQEEAESLAV